MREESSFSSPVFTRFFVARACHSYAMQIMTTAVAWQVWEVTKDPIYLAWIGLAVFLPVLLLVVPAGLAADRFDRKVISAFCSALEAVAAVGLIYFSMTGATALWIVFTCLALIGVASAFGSPAASALVPNMLNNKQLAHGISINTMTWQSASVLGPPIGGLLFLYGAPLTYTVALVLSLCAVGMMFTLGTIKQSDQNSEDTGLAAVAAGFKFIWQSPIVLGAISLDMFAVLLGGAKALLPIYADVILQVGPVGNGLLRAAPGIGAVAVGLWLARYGIKDRAGWWLFIAVALTGLVIIVFGYSTLAWLSILMLALYGAFDMISVYVREVLMQLWTPDALRGRVNAVNNVFLGASNELGEFRAGLAAFFWGAVPAVVIGGFGTIAIAGLWAWAFPALRDARKLEKV